MSDIKARLEALTGEPYVLADVLCHLYHDYEIGTLTGFMTEKGFVVSCAECKHNAQFLASTLVAILEGWDA